jgi:nitrile hydratase accessory protein
MTISKPSKIARGGGRNLLVYYRDAEQTMFGEPWEAQAFALAVKLSEQGHFTWKEWTAILAHELKAATDRGEIDDGSRYYHYWLAALEKLVTTKGLTDQAALDTCKEAWADAYRHTPHGKAVELHAGSRVPPDISELTLEETSPTG